jgi:predicted phosphoribosyltransferase
VTAHHHFRRRFTAPPSNWNAHGLARQPSAGARALFAFDDRRTAGRVLAEWIEPLTDERSVVVAIAGGGVHVADEVARILRVPFDVAVVEPITVAGFPCAELGAIAVDGTVKLDHELAAHLGVTADALAKAIEHQRAAVSQRAASVHGEAELDLAGRTVFLVDEALDSGIVAATAVESLRQRGCDRIIVAVPVADRTSVSRVSREADDVIAVLMPGTAGPRSHWYRELPPVSDADVAETLALG